MLLRVRRPNTTTFVLVLYALILSFALFCSLDLI